MRGSPPWSPEPDELVGYLEKSRGHPAERVLEKHNIENCQSSWQSARLVDWKEFCFKHWGYESRYLHLSFFYINISLYPHDKDLRWSMITFSLSRGHRLAGSGKGKWAKGLRAQAMLIDQRTDGLGQGQSGRSLTASAQASADDQMIVSNIRGDIRIMIPLRIYVLWSPR